MSKRFWLYLTPFLGMGAAMMVVLFMLRGAMDNLLARCAALQPDKVVRSAAIKGGKGTFCYFTDGSEQIEQDWSDAQ